MLFAEVRLFIESDTPDDDLESLMTWCSEEVEIAPAIQALEEGLPELPQGAKWKVEWCYD